MPDYCIFVSGLTFLPPFYSSWGEAPSRVSEAVLEVFRAPEVPDTSMLRAFKGPPELSFHIHLSQKVSIFDVF